MTGTEAIHQFIFLVAGLTYVIIFIDLMTK